MTAGEGSASSCLLAELYVITGAGIKFSNDQCASVSVNNLTLNLQFVFLAKAPRRWMVHHSMACKNGPLACSNGQGSHKVFVRREEKSINVHPSQVCRSEYLLDRHDKMIKIEISGVALKMQGLYCRSSASFDGGRLTTTAERHS